ncbi:exonuclease VIII [Escherichia coli]|nr:exonuclease VIII [Escherichia coli]
MSERKNSKSVSYTHLDVYKRQILRRSYERQGIPCPWRYYNDRDVRTIVELGKDVYKRQRCV